MDRIKLLPDTVANQIAAGEVVNRPASVVKELLENALDAGGTTITVNFKDGGRELIQVVDNGVGMNERDAIMAFERHATSKIREASDLYKLHSFGFRGEALASIASVSEVELRTRTADSELGCCVVINGGKLESQHEVQTPYGTQFIVKNLFYNVPARRRFLKEANVEARHITSEFQRVALCNPEVEFILYNNGNLIYNLASTSLRQRIVDVHGRSMSANLLDLFVDTSIVKIEGYVGRPKSAKKSNREQYMFVNGRYFRSAYFHKAIVQAYDKLIASDTQPSYFVYLTIDPARIDVNVHPAKTEIKFDDESSMWQIFNAAVRESLGRTGSVPMMDFEIDNSIEIPVYREGVAYKIPDVSLNHDFNPFADEVTSSANSKISNSLVTNSSSSFSISSGFSGSNVNVYNDDLREFDSESGDFEEYDSSVREFISGEPESQSTATFDFVDQIDSEIGVGDVLRLGANRCVATIKGRILIFDIRRAHFRVLFERYLKMLGGNGSVSQQLLFPEVVELAPDECSQIGECMDEITSLGFDLRIAGEGMVEVTGIPTNMSPSAVCDSLHATLALIREATSSALEQRYHAIACSLASRMSYSQRDNFETDSIRALLEELLLCDDHNYTPTGLPIVTVIDEEELDKRFR